MIKPDIQNIQSPKETKNALISLQDAAKIYGYTQYHFGLLCRQGKLKSERKGKKWLTRRIWIEEYLGTLKEHYKSANSHYTNGFERISVSIAIPEPEVAKPSEEISVFLFSGKDFCKSPFSEIPPKKSDFSPKAAFGFAFSFAAIILLVYFLGAGFFPREYFPASVKNLNARFSTSVVSLVSDLSERAFSLSDFSKFQNRVSLFSERTKNNLRSFFSGVKSTVFAVRDFILDPKTKLIGFVSPPPPPEEGKVVEPRIRDGLVVFPSKENVSKETAVKMVKDSFSDEVIVKPDEDGDTGVIQPVFKKGKGEEYIYVMVPAKEKNLPVEASMKAGVETKKQ